MAKLIFGVALLGTLCCFAVAWPQKKSSSTTVAPGTQNSFNLTFVVAAKDLPSKKKNSLPNSYVKVSQRTGGTGDWTDIGQTPVMDSNANPDFNHVFWFMWNKGTRQQWHFEVKNKHTLSKDDVLAQVDVNVDDFVLKDNQDLTVRFPQKEGGTLLVKKTTPIRFQLYARSLPKLDAFGGASDPFVECYWRRGADGNDTLFYTTGVQDDKENADWNDIIEFSNYQKGTNQYLHFKVWDKDPTIRNDYLGDALVEVDPYAQKRATKANKLKSDIKDSKATLTITPV